jgi:hypothetical protein
MRIIGSAKRIATSLQEESFATFTFGGRNFYFSSIRRQISERGKQM